MAEQLAHPVPGPGRAAKVNYGYDRGAGGGNEPNPQRKNLTWVGGDRDPATLDYTSRRILDVTGTGTSIFDPVLCEIAYRWFCPPRGLVLDPFAGGSVRGIVAAKLGRGYVGIDLRREQCAANEKQADAILADKTPRPLWLCGDAAEALSDLPYEPDFIFTCPPYGGLEIYSDLPGDLSQMPHDEFIAAYEIIIRLAVKRLKQDRFAAIVVGDFRDPAGFYRNFVSATVAAFESAGAKLYNEAILVTAAGSLPIRAGKQFATTRKLGKTHQQFLIFCKGDPRKATTACGPVEIDEALFSQPEAFGEPL